MLALITQFRRNPDWQLLYRGSLIYCTKTGIVEAKDQKARTILKDILGRCDYEGFVRARFISEHNKNFQLLWQKKR